MPNVESGSTRRFRTPKSTRRTLNPPRRDRVASGHFFVRFFRNLATIALTLTPMPMKFGCEAASG